MQSGVRAHAEFTDIPTIVDGRLDPFLEELQKEIYEVSDEVEAHFFRAAPISNSISRGGHEARDPLSQRVQLREPAWGVAQSAPSLSGQRRPSAVDRIRSRGPPTTRVHSYTDYWGTRVDEFGIVEPHRDLRIMAESTVETATPQAPSGEAASARSTRCERSCRAFSVPRPTPSGTAPSKRQPGRP